jgi:hypothetical protein
LKAEPLSLPLLTTVYGKPRSLVVRTSDWPKGYRKALEDRLLKVIVEVRKAIRECRPQRVWIFFYSHEADFNQTEFDVALQPGVAVLVRHLPRRWNLRAGNTYRAKRARPLPDTGPAVGTVELPVDPPESDPALTHTRDEPGLAPPELSEPIVEQKPAPSGQPPASYATRAEALPVVDILALTGQPASTTLSGPGSPAPEQPQPTAHISKLRRFIDRVWPSRFLSR